MAPITQRIIDKIVKGLSKDQENAVVSEKQYLRIIASAGAGKTETITRRIIYLIAKGVESKSIVAFTFTEKAAQEMKERVYRRLEEILGEEKTKNIGDMYIGTIHGFCFQILQDNFGFGNYDVLDENQEMAFVMRHGWGLGLHTGKNYSSNCQAFIRSVNVVLDELLDHTLLEEQAPEFSKHLKTYTERLYRHKLLTFGMMIYIAVQNLAKEPNVISNISHLVVDEYQDINKTQERLIWQISNNANCYIVGDPRQCIYEWRGSAPECFNQFADHFDCETISITENRRSVKQIVNVGNSVAQNFDSDMLKHPMNQTRKDNGKAIYVSHEDAEEEAKWIAIQIRKLVDLSICTYSDIAILLRSVSTSGPKIADELKKSDIPYLVGGRIGLFQRPEAQAMGMIFAWCADMHWQPNQWARESISGDQLIETALELWPYDTSFEAIEDFKADITSGRFNCLTEAYQDLLITLRYINLNPDESNDAVIIANLGRFNTLLTDFETEQRRGGEKLKWEIDLRNLVWFMNTYALGAYEEQPSDDLRGVDAIQLYTVHQAKGLEWPIVFVPALTSRRFPSSMMGKSNDWLVPRDLFEVNRYEGDMESERKLFYVATTRARDSLILSRFKRIKISIKESPFIKEASIPESTPSIDPVVHEIQKKQDNEEEILTYSPAEIIEFNRCAHFYRMRELWGYKPIINEMLGYGRSIHHIIRMVTEGVAEGKNPGDYLEEIIEDEFHLPYANPGKLEGIRRSAKSAIFNYIKNHIDEIKSTKEVESRLEFKLSKRVTISGRIDAIFDIDETLEVRDYKTADDPRTELETALQLRLYSLGLNELGQSVDKASLAIISGKSDKVAYFDISETSLEEARSDAKTIINRIIERDFSPNCGEFCQRCDYQRICYFKKDS